VQLDNGDVAAAAQPWQPPSEAITDMLIDQLLYLVAAGDRGRPFSRMLGNYDRRSIGKALISYGIASKKGQQAALEALWTAGCGEAAWRKPNRDTAMGIRHPDGRPVVQWIE
jgi:hypothetical protein